MANNEAVLSEAVDQVVKRPSVQFNVPPIKDEENFNSDPRQLGQDTVTRTTTVTKNAQGKN